MPNQKDQILDELQHWGSVCGTTLLQMHFPRYAARIAELRAEGHQIVTERCERGWHLHRTKQVQYRLIPDATLF